MMDYAASSFEIKALDEAGHIEGLLAGFGDVDNGGDRLLQGCFAKTLAERGDIPLPMLLFHDTRRPIGAWTEWQERQAGLYVKGSLVLATGDGQEAYALAKAGALTGLSIGWEAKREAVDQRTGVRTVTEAKLYEGSLVAIPMNDRTRVATVKAVTSPADIEELLRAGGLSGRWAKQGASAVWRIKHEKDEDAEAEAELAAMIQASTARLSAKGGR